MIANYALNLANWNMAAALSVVLLLPVVVLFVLHQKIAGANLLRLR